MSSQAKTPIQAIAPAAPAQQAPSSAGGSNSDRVASMPRPFNGPMDWVRPDIEGMIHVLSAAWSARAGSELPVILAMAGMGSEDGGGRRFGKPTLGATMPPAMIEALRETLKALNLMPVAAQSVNTGWVTTDALSGAEARFVFTGLYRQRKTFAQGAGTLSGSLSGARGAESVSESGGDVGLSQGPLSATASMGASESTSSEAGGGTSASMEAETTGSTGTLLLAYSLESRNRSGLADKTPPILVEAGPCRVIEGEPL